MSLPRTLHDQARLHFPQARVVAAVRAFDSSQRARVQDAAHHLIDCLQDFADRGQVPLAAAVESTETPCLWQHYQGSAATPLGDRPQALHYYYHSHAVTGASLHEHGHYHLFTQLGADEDDTPRYTHIVAIGVDARGLPLRLFTTNRWVTNETWQPAERVVDLANRIARDTDPSEDATARWLRAQLGIFAPQINALLRHRDRRVRVRTQGGQRPGLMEDRRMHVLSQCRVSFEHQLAAFDHAIH
jgi:hypothetical protein